jgi:hypothetical protein
VLNGKEKHTRSRFEPVFRQLRGNCQPVRRDTFALRLLCPQLGDFTGFDEALNVGWLFQSMRWLFESSRIDKLR